MKTMKAVKFLMFACLVGIIAGCKLAVIVVEGGEVQSTGSGTCVAGTVCIVDVPDTNFSDAFTAVPDEGWYFEKWVSAESFFCSNSTDPTCTLSLVAGAGNSGIEALVASSETFYLMPIFKMANPITDTITVNGKVWAQVDLFANLSWDDINAVCPAGTCAGALKGHDMTGWTWASVDDINGLFNFYLGSDLLGPGPDEYGSGEGNTSWTTAFFDDWRSFNLPCCATGGTPGLGGWVRSLANEFEAYTPFIGVGITIDGDDVISTNGTLNIDDEEGYLGGWFYRTP